MRCNGWGVATREGDECGITLSGAQSTGLCPDTLAFTRFTAPLNAPLTQITYILFQFYYIRPIGEASGPADLPDHARITYYTHTGVSRS
jgi:hypothetical protein